VPKNILLSVCLISYNTADLTLAAIKSAIEDANRSALLAHQTEIIVVDNASTDDSIPKLQSLKKEISLGFTLIINKKNLGFTTANNQAIKQAKGEYILLLNSDTFVQAGALEKLVQAMIDNPEESTATLSSHSGKLDRLGILAATLINPDGTVQPQGGSLPSLFTLFYHLMIIDDLPILGRLLPSTQHTGWRATNFINQYLFKTGWVAGTAMLIKRDLIKEIGLLDKNIFMYGEDVEFCLRASHHHWDVAIHPTAFVTHLKSASSTTLNAIVGEMNGYLYLWAKHFPSWQSVVVRALIYSGLILRIIIFGTIGQTKRSNLYRIALGQIKF